MSGFRKFRFRVQHPVRRLLPLLVLAFGVLQIAPFVSSLAEDLPLQLSAQILEEAGPVEGIEAERTSQAVRISSSVDMVIDGRLDEPAWDEAVPITEFRQEEPVEGGEPSEFTEVRVLYDSENLYIGAELHDSDPQGIIGWARQRNAGLGSDDQFRLLLDTFADGRTGFLFETNPAGVMRDGILVPSSRPNRSWDGIWEVRSRIHEGGWTVEMRIPFSTLNFDPELDSWGVNFERTIQRKNETVRWAGWRRNQSFIRPIHAGRLSGIGQISQGLGLEVKPFATGNWESHAQVPERGGIDPSMGLDVQYNITPSLRAAATLNTDFAEVEVDDRVVNLSRFPVSLPERRGFFLEGSSIFNFGSRMGVEPFFSRRIGLQDGIQIPIDFGARLGGQAGRYELGLFQVRTGGMDAREMGASHGVPAEDFTATRVRRTFFSQSSVGAIYTRRASGSIPTFDGPGGDEDSENGSTPLAQPTRHTAGVDFDLSTANFRGRYNAQMEGFFAWHNEPVADGTSSFADRRARGLRFSFPNDVWSIRGSIRDFGTAFNPAMGFQRRNGFRRTQPTLSWSPRPEGIDWLREFQFELRHEYLTDLDGRLLTRDNRLTFLRMDFESQDRIELDVTRNFERLDQAFEIYDGVLVPAGGFGNTEWSVDLRTAGQRAVSGRLDLSHGGFWSGTRNQLRGEVTVQPAPGVSVSGEYRRNEVDLPQGEFDTNLIRMGGDWNPTPRQSLTSSLQYDDVSGMLGLFLRGRWILSPGNDVFLVYTHDWSNQAERIFDRHLETLARGAAIKVNYTMRF